MKTICNLLSLVLVSSFLFCSCTADSVENPTPEAKINTESSVAYTYNSIELETLSLINNYRKSIGINTLEKINFISVKSQEHVNYMITNNVVNHNDFVSRSNEIIRVLGARNVSENIAYNYATPAAAFDAWLKSPIHKENIVGNYTHFGISVREDPATGKKYYVNIFAKI
ncbi:CAP domain-containing protein [Flavobacterium sp.]|uniref:CAP domain-containing protein n=1 Tax=Flavobacterium sp. TaxID=239 RepID=UPI00262096A0|nr:CAP domain-containing protein [Flavobacterium sp.]